MGSWWSFLVLSYHMNQACDFMADSRYFLFFELKNMTPVIHVNLLRKIFPCGGGGYLVSIESSLKMQEDGVYFMLISWTYFKLSTVKPAIQTYCIYLMFHQELLAKMSFAHLKIGEKCRSHAISAFLLWANHMPDECMESRDAQPCLVGLLDDDVEHLCVNSNFHPPVIGWQELGPVFISEVFAARLELNCGITNLLFSGY